MNGFRFNEKYLSQIPALQLLINLGFEYLSPSKALTARLGKTGNILLEGILADQLKRINRIQHKGRQFLFSEENIQTAIQKLKNINYDGLLKTNDLHPTYKPDPLSRNEGVGTIDLPSGLSRSATFTSIAQNRWEKFERELE